MEVCWIQVVYALKPLIKFLIYSTRSARSLHLENPHVISAAAQKGVEKVKFLLIFSILMKLHGRSFWKERQPSNWEIYAMFAG